MSFLLEYISSLVHFSTFFIQHMHMYLFELKRITAGQMHVYSECIHDQAVSHQIGILMVFQNCHLALHLLLSSLISLKVHSYRHIFVVLICS